MSKVQYGLNINGVVRVFSKEKQIQSNGNTFNITDVWFNVSEKGENGEYENVSTNLVFGRNVESPVNNSIVYINEAFPVLRGKGKYRKVAYFVKSWNYVEQPQQQGQQYNQAPPQGQQYNQAPPQGQQYNQAPPQGGYYNGGQQNTGY